MTLAIEQPPGIGEQAERDTQTYWDTIDQAEHHLLTMGIPPVKKPDFAAPELDSDLYGTLSRGDGRMVTYKHLQFSAWYSYAASLLGQIKGRILQVENEMKDIRRKVRKSLVEQATTAADKKPSIELIEDYAHRESRYRELNRDLQTYVQIADQLESAAKKYSAGVKVTSRSVEIRRQELEGLGGGRAYTDQRFPDD